MRRLLERTPRRWPLQRLVVALLCSVALLPWAAAGAQSPPGGQDSQPLQQDPLLIKGNRGLPKTLFIAPWKKVQGEVPEGSPLESDLARAIKPVDQEVFRRELELYEEGYSVE